MLKIASFNVNSIRSRLMHLLDILKSDQAPDILLLQELKCTDENFPRLEIEDLGYNIAIFGQKTYNGVAILSKYPIDETILGLPKYEGAFDYSKFPEEFWQEARYIESVISLKNTAIRVASVYVPNGGEITSLKFQFKLAFLECLAVHMNKLLKFDEMVVVGGDYNVAPAPIDVYDAKSLDGTTCYHPLERKNFRKILGLGYIDIYRTRHPDLASYTWWDYRQGAWQHNKGMRIDHLLLSPKAADATIATEIDLKPREKDKPSDHTIIWCDIEP